MKKTREKLHNSEKSIQQLDKSLNALLILTQWETLSEQQRLSRMVPQLNSITCFVGFSTCFTLRETIATVQV